jgi:hypothetical protein
MRVYSTRGRDVLRDECARAPDVGKHGEKNRLMLRANSDVPMLGKMYDVKLKDWYARSKKQKESSKGATTRRLDHV